MRTFLRITAALGAALCLQFVSRGADLTNTWDFMTAGDYQVSNSNYIEVADGVAKLKLIADEKYRSRMQDYDSNGARVESLRTGADVSILLTRSAGFYSSFGLFTSRTMVGPAGNTWNQFKAKSYNLVLDNAGNELFGSESGVVGLWHMNNNWRDASARGNNGTAYGASFTPTTVQGSHGGNFVSGDIQVNGLPLVSTMTLAFWVKAVLADATDMNFLLVAANTGVNQLAIRLGGSSTVLDPFSRARAIAIHKPQLSVGAGTASGTWTDNDINRWQHVAIVYNNGSVAIYKNGISVPVTFNTLSGGVPSHNQIRIGSSFGAYKFSGYLDELVVYDRALSFDEIYVLYKRPRSVLFKVRSGTDEASLAGSEFVGPSGTNSFYLGEGETVEQVDGGFRPWERYVQYRAYFYGPATGAETPFVDGVSFVGTTLDMSDDAVGDFRSGMFTSNTTVFPSVYDTPYLGLAKTSNGGYGSVGTFTSRVFTNNIVGDFWQRLYWATPPELVVTNDSARLGLWHVNNDSWSDYSGKGNHGSPSGVQYSEFGKLGSHAAIFDGASSYVSIGTIATSVKTLEFWFKNDSVNDGIMGFRSGSFLVLSNRLIQPVGLPSDTLVYVNGGPSRRILSGWNHVAIASATGWSVTNLVVGLANGDYMDGMLDEMAAYSRVMDLSEIKGHFVSARQPHAGRARFQVRGGDVLPLTGAFVGPGNSTTDYYVESGAPIYQLPLVTSKYMQYRVFFVSDGDVTPTVDSVTVATIYTNSVDSTLDTVAMGTFDEGTTRWCGDEVKLLDIGSIPGISNLKPVNGMEGLWHLDETSWGQVTDSSGKARHATARNGAAPLAPGQVGVRCGTFDGVNDDISLPGIPLTSTFSVYAWFKSTAATRSAILSHATGDWVLEFNGNGVSTVPGAVTFSVGSGGTRRNCVAATGGLNDGRWHHVAGVREGDYIHVYVDGTAAGTMSLGGAVPNPSYDGALVAHHGIINTYFAGQVDEVAIFSTAVSEAWLRQSIAMGFDTEKVGAFTSEVFDAGGAAIWERISWQANASFGNPLTSTGGVVGLWHLDGITGGNLVVDASSSANNGTVVNATVSNDGRFGACLSFDGAGDYVSIPGAALPSASPFSVEAWVRPSDAGNRTIFDRRSGGSGYALLTDADGKLCFWVSSVTNRSVGGLRPGMWNHVAGVYDGKRIRSYINGDVVACSELVGGTLSAGNARLGSSEGGHSGDFLGLIDEVAVHTRGLTAEEVRDHARAGFGTLRFQVCVTNVAAPASPVFSGPDGTTNTYFTVAGETMVGKIPLGQYFQFRAELSTTDGLLEPRLQGFIVNQSRYPSDHPWVRPAVAKGAPFYGKLLTFSHAIATNVDSAVRYQVSGDNGTNWYWWSGSQWEPDGAGLGWLAANSVSLVNTNIGTFYSQLYQAKGGSFSFKAYLDSDGATQTAIDWAQLTKSRGRIVLLQPNGSERGEKAWVVGVPYAITWSSTGTVSGNIRIDLYNLSGSNFVRTIAANVPNTGSYTGVVGEDYGFDYRIRIRDLNDSTVEDWSDGDFELVQNLHLSVPNGGGKWYVGETNVVKWESPGWGGNNLGSPMELWFSADAGTNWQVIASVPNVVGNNSYAWLTPSNNASLVSEWAKMGVAVPGVPHPLTSFGDVSDGTFTNAGIAVTYPSIGAGVKMGNTITIRWTAAGAGATVSIDFFDGLSWSNITPDAACTPGTNTYDAPLNAPNPTTAARVRVSSNSDPKVWGVSDPFTLADVNIVVPVGGGAARAKWQMGTVKRVKWTAGGAGNSVDIHYTVDGVNWMVDGTNWVPIALNVTNVNSGGTVVTNESPDWVIPAPPTNMARVRVRSTTQTDLYAITEPFDIAGVHVAEPNGTINDNKDWEFVETNVVKWMHQAAGGQIAIEIAYEDNPATNEFESLYDSLSMFLTQRLISPSVVRRPSNYARIRVRAFSPPAETELLPMQDVSDSSFKIKGMSVVAPGSNAVYTMGTTVSQGLQWYSASAGSTSARFYYSTNASSFPTNTFYANQLNEDDGPAAGLNVRDFVVPRNQTPSTVSRIKIASGVYGAVSMPFTLRGIRINQPAAGQMVNIGAVNQAVVWASAGLQFSARAVGAVSTGGIGGPWQNGGMSTNISVLNAGVVWNVDPDLEPTTNAVMRLSVFSPTNDTDIVMYSDAFTLRGLRISAPAEGAVVDLGGSTAVTLKSAGMGAGARAAVYYAPDDVNFDFENPVTNEMSVVDGANSFTWVIESSPALTRMPSTNAHLMVVSGSFTNISRPFTVRGIKVTSPSRTDIWAVSDVTNVIKWKSVNAGPSYNLTFQLWSGGTVVYTEPIVSGYTGNEFVWTMTNSAVGSNVTIKVQDATYTGWSELFEIVPQPSIRILNPKAGDFWKVGTTNLIQWSRGGNVDNDFAVAYSVSPFDVTNYLRIGACDYTNGVFSLRWGPMPSTLGRTRIIVTNRVDALVADSFENFDIAARFDIQSFGSELYALETVGINWITRGNVASVDLFYSTDPLRASNSWVQINTNAPYAENVGNDLPVTPYAWLVPNIKTPEMWLRIQDHNYAGRQFVANKPGPFNDFGTFPVKYYTITWHVLDTATSNHLDGLSVSDSSGWSAANMASPVVHEYPNGVFDTVWFKEFFIDAVAFNWSSRPSRTNTVWMKRSDVEKGIQVLADFAFDAYTNRMTIHAWAQRAGLLLTDPSQCDVTVYSAAGQSLMTLSSTTPLSDSGKATGVFRIEWNNVTNVLAYGGTYFAKVTIVYSGQIYSSVVTYTLRLAMDMTAGQAVLDAIGTSQVNVQSNILEVASNLNALASAQSVFSSNAMERLNTLTGGVASIQTGVTNISQALGVLPGIASNVAVMLPLVTNIEARVAGIETTVSGTKSRILTRPETMIFGTTNTILYKSTAGFGSTVSLVVSNSLGGGPAAHVTTMGEVVAGLYQSDLVANWGSNSYVITCYDPPTTPQPGWDSIVVRVGAAPLTGNVALDQLLDDVSRIEQRITNVTEMLNGLTNTTDMLQVLDVSVGFLQDELTNILRTVTNMEVTVNTLTNLSTAAQVLTALDWGAISNVGGLASTMTNLQASVTNIQASLNSVTNLSGAMVAINGIQGSVSNLQISVGALTNLQSVVGVLTNVDWGAVSNIGGLSTSMTNMQATLALVQASVGGVSNYVVLLTNLPALASNVTNIQNSVADLQGAMAALTNLGDVVASLTNVDWGAISNMGSLGVTLSDIQTSVTNMEVSIGALANLGTVVASLTNVDWNAVSNVGGISASLTNIQGTVSGLQTTLGSVTNYMVTLTNLPAVASNVTNVQGAIANLQASMSALTNLGSVVSSLTNVNWNAVSNVGGISASLTNIQNTVSALQTSVGAVSNYVVALTNFPSLATSVTNMQGAIANIQASVNSLSNLGSVVSSLTNVNWGAVSNVGGLSVALTNIQATLTNMPVLAGNVTNIQGQIGTIQTSLASLTNLGAAVSALTNVDWSAMAGVSALAGSVSNIQASVTNISLIQASVNDLADKMAGVDWDGLAGVPDSLNQFAPALQGLGTTAGSDISSIMRNVQDLARQAGQSGSSISDVQSGVRAIQQAMTALNGLQDRLGSGDAGQPSDSLFTRLSVLADSVGKIAGDASDASKSAQSAKTEAANASAGIQSIKDAMGRGDVTGVSAGLDKIREQLAAVRKAIDGISPAKETSSIEETVKKMAAEVEAFSKSTGVKWLTEMKEPPKVGVGEGTDGKRVEDLNAVLLEVRGRLEFLQKMIQDLRDKPVVEESLIGG